MTETIELAVAGHRALERRRWSVLLGTTAVLAVSLVLDVVTGPALLPVGEVVASILRLGGVDPTTDIIVWSLRLPMALMAVVVGIALASGGAAMQSTLDNVLASPYTLGLASAAGFGASFAIVFGGFGLNPLFSVPACAFVGASIAATFIHILGYWRKADGDTIILAGIATMFLFHSLQSILQFRATPEVGQQIVFLDVRHPDQSNLDQSRAHHRHRRAFASCHRRQRMENHGHAARRGTRRGARRSRRDAPPRRHRLRFADDGDGNQLRWHDRLYRPGRAAYRPPPRR